MKVDIYIREKSGSRQIRIPILPEKILFPGGDAIFVTNRIMYLGEVAIPTGTELSTYSWESEFPGELRKSDPMLMGTWQDPKNYKNILEDWKKNRTLLNLIVTGYPINVDVYCRHFSPYGAGPYGDIAYEIEFVEARNITITSTKVQTNTQTNTQTQATQQTQRPTSNGKTHTTVSGDTLWGISKKYYGSGAKWKTIYDANKEIIEKTAKDHGRSSSQNGNLLYPGITLTIPDANS